MCLSMTVPENHIHEQQLTLSHLDPNRIDNGLNHADPNHVTAHRIQLVAQLIDERALRSRQEQERLARHTHQRRLRMALLAAILGVGAIAFLCR